MSAGPTPPPSADPAVQATLRAIRARAPDAAPRVGIVLGSGWGAVAQAVQDAVVVPYPVLPAFPPAGVGGHAGLLHLGRLGAHPVAVLAGRQHAYETGAADGMKGAIRTLAALGVTTLVLTNAAGSLDAAMPPGALMRITDHLNLPQRSPLVGEPGDGRFVDMVNAYDPALGARADAAAARAGVPLHQGVYAWVLGPQFETPAEIRMIRALGAQAVGMSTVPEVILARHAGLRVLGLSMITNLAAGMEAQGLSHAHTLNTAKGAADAARALLTALLDDPELAG